MSFSASRTLQPGEFYGERSRVARLGDYILTDLEHADARQLPSHSHQAAFISVLVKGSYREEIGRKRIAHPRFGVCFHPPGFEHRDEVGPQSRFLTIELTAGSEANEAVDMIASCDQGLQTGNASLKAIQLYAAFRSGSEPLELESLVTELLSVASPRPFPVERMKPCWLRQAEDLLHDRYSEGIRLSAAAREIGVHPIRLARAFRRFHHESMGHYVLKLRIRRACEALQDEDASLAGIAAECGFYDQSHFVKAFKSLIGTTPRRTRQLIS